MINTVRHLINRIFISAQVFYIVLYGIDLVIHIQQARGYVGTRIIMRIAESTVSISGVPRGRVNRRSFFLPNALKTGSN